MAKAFPNSQFYGFDNHIPSIEAAKEMAKKEGVGNVEFRSGSANESIGSDYDFVTLFDCLHDMGHPVGAMKFVKQSLKTEWHLYDYRTNGQ
jgi:2-polyprenyl-3-methyl-5-hydroxy-6-metoxy-1,4-benzoquinol methylase